MRTHYLLSALVVVSSSVWGDEPLRFKGLELGASFEQFRLAVPQPTCTESRCYVVPATQCTKLPSWNQDECRQAYWYGGVFPKYIGAEFADEKLASVYLTLSERSFGPLLAAMLEKFGPPHTDLPTVIQNRAGANFDNRTVTWTRSGTILVLTRRSSTIDESAVLFTSKAHQERQAAERAQKAKAAAKDL